MENVTQMMRAVEVSTPLVRAVGKSPRVLQRNELDRNILSNPEAVEEALRRHNDPLNLDQNSVIVCASLFQLHHLLIE